MLRLLTGDSAAEWGCSSRGRQVGFSTGLGMLVPGLLQHRWGQQQRGWVFFGSFLSALMVALWTWGTVPGSGFLMLAFLTHVASVTDVLRQGSFPVFPRKRRCARGRFAWVRFLLAGHHNAVSDGLARI